MLDNVTGLFLALLAGISAAHKLSDRERALSATAGLFASRRGMAQLGWGTAVACELAAASLLLIPSTRAVGAMMLAGLWAAYTALLLRARQQRNSADCGCSFGRHGGPGRFEIMRNVILLLLALSTASANPDPLPFLDWIMAGTAALAFLLLYLAADDIVGRTVSLGERR